MRVVARTDTVRRRHLDDELFHLDGDSRTPGPAARRAIVLAGDQLAVPAQDRVGRDKPRELAEPEERVTLGDTLPAGLKLVLDDEA
jgi:hypothetical protein